MFNRKERLQISKKFKSKSRNLKNNINWRQLNNEKKRQKEEQILKELEERQRHSEIEKTEQSTKLQLNQRTWYSLIVALPGSILNNIQTRELKAYVLGQLARTFAIFCVDEIIIFDENAQLKQSQIDEYYAGNWNGEEQMRENNSECNFHMARIFEYLECPQYLRKDIFPIHESLKYAGLLNPLDAMHHLRSTNLELPYREGIVLDKSTKDGQQLCNVGLDRDLILTNSPEWIEPKTRITVKISTPIHGSKRLKGTLTNAKTVREEIGVYWGYSVRIAKSLSDIQNEFDFVIGTSERGSPVSELSIPYKQNYKILLIFGGLAGLEAAMKMDEGIEQSDPAKYFPNYINFLPDQGSRIIRTEEAIPICLTALKCKLDQFK